MCSGDITERAGLELIINWAIRLKLQEYSEEEKNILPLKCDVRTRNYSYIRNRQVGNCSSSSAPYVRDEHTSPNKQHTLQITEETL